MSLYQELYTKMGETFAQRAGYAPDEASDLGLRMQALAVQLEHQALEIEQLARQAYPETATGEALDRHAQTRGLERKPGVSAAGALTFRREAAVGYDVLIPAGTLCQTPGEQPVRFQTAQDGVLEAGQTQVTVPARSVDQSPDANLAARQVTVMVTPPQGIAGVANQEPFVGGTAPETDEGLLARMMASYRAASNGCNPGYYRQLALEQPGVSSAAILTGKRGRGSVDLVVYGQGAAPSGPQLAALQARVGEEREIGVDALVRAAQGSPVTLSVRVGYIPGWDTPAVTQDCTQRLTRLVRGLRVGQPLYLAQVVAAVLEADGVVDCKVLAPEGDAHPLEDQVLTLGSLAVSLQEVG